MLLGLRISLLCPLMFGLLACDKPDTVELGAVCTDDVECKDPADSCITVVGEPLCSMVCSAEKACPDDYACARMDVKVQTDGKTVETDVRGYCLPTSRLGAHVATIRPKKTRKKKGKKGKKGRKNRKRAVEGDKPKADESKAQ